MLNTVGILHTGLAVLEGAGHNLSFFCEDLEKSVLCDTSLNSYCLGILKAWTAQYGCMSSFHACLSFVLTGFRDACISACMCLGFCTALHRAHTVRCWVPFGIQGTRPRASSKELSLQIESFLSSERHRGFFPLYHSCGLHTTIGTGTAGWCRFRFLFKWKWLLVMDDMASFSVRKIDCQILTAVLNVCYKPSLKLKLEDSKFVHKQTLPFNRSFPLTLLPAPSGVSV